MSTTPLVSNPVSIFFIVLVIILLAPILLNKLKIPHIVGMIVAGVIIGPYGLNILARDSSFEIFGQVGILYLMFLAGLEIDMYHLKVNLKRGLMFGVLTLLIPLALGVLTSRYILHLDWITSTLLGSMYASHTLISYPVVARIGVTKAPSVLIAIVGTIIAVIGALLVLAGTVEVKRSGNLDVVQLVLLLVRLLVYCIAVLYLYPRITRWFFKRYIDRVTQYVFIMAMVFLSAWAAQTIGLESVLGAFFAGLVLNRYVPGASPLMNNIEFVGNALFIPYFLMGVGMMINVRVLANSETLEISLLMLVVALVSKWLPAFVIQKANHMDRPARNMMFGLTTAHTAVALAVVSLGYSLELLDETILNSTVLVILVTCALAPMITSRAATRVKIRIINQGEDDDEIDVHGHKYSNTLISIANPITVQGLVEMAVFMKNDTGRHEIFALNVRNDNSPKAKAMSSMSLDMAMKTAAAANVQLQPLERYDINTVTGLLNSIEERDISEVIMGMHRKTTVIDSFLGAKIEQLLKSTNKMLIMMRCFTPLNTVTRIVVSVPAKAQYETGFRRWVRRVANLTRQLGCRVLFCAPTEVQPFIKGVLHADDYGIRYEFRTVDEWEDFILLGNRILDDDLLIVVSARVNSVSYSSDMSEMSGFLQKYFSRQNLVIIYPEQFGQEVAVTSFVDPLASDIAMAESPLWNRLRGWYRRAMGMKKKITHRNRTKRIDF
jgi:Kef-type K+ transport system membrane component KefB/phage gp36-like protein